MGATALEHVRRCSSSKAGQHPFFKLFRIGCIKDTDVGVLLGGTTRSFPGPSGGTSPCANPGRRVAPVPSLPGRTCPPGSLAAGASKHRSLFRQRRCSLAPGTFGATARRADARQAPTRPWTALHVVCTVLFFSRILPPVNARAHLTTVRIAWQAGRPPLSHRDQAAYSVDPAPGGRELAAAALAFSAKPW